jgi:hypothetical protein
MQKANKLNEIDAAVHKFTPVTPDHPFFVDFKNLRGDFQEREVMRMLNVDRKDDAYVFDFRPNQANKTLLFLAGMRGSGKTSELAKYAQQLDSPTCFFVITCNVDEELDMDNVQYMDILVFQLEKLLTRSREVGLKLDDSILESMEKWFQDRFNEINRSLSVEGGSQMEIGSTDGFGAAELLGRLLGITLGLKAGLSGSYERAQTIRTNLKNRFIDFATKFNTFIEQTNEQLRKEKKGQEILFIVDGLEKTMSADTRRKIIMEESNRIRQIKANTIFTLPIELMKEEQRIRHFSEIVSFPFIKIIHRDGSPVAEAIIRFEEFVYRRISKELFESPETVHTAIQYSGGSPRQLLRIIEMASWQTDTEVGKITQSDMQRAVQKLGNSTARYLEPTDFEVLKRIKNDLEVGNPIGFDGLIQGLLEKEIIFEYNDGTYKRVNPLLEISKLYRHHVLGTE